MSAGGSRMPSSPTTDSRLVFTASLVIPERQRARKCYVAHVTPSRPPTKLRLVCPTGQVLVTLPSAVESRDVAYLAARGKGRIHGNSNGTTSSSDNAKGSSVVRGQP